MTGQKPSGGWWIAAAIALFLAGALIETDRATAEHLIGTGDKARCRAFLTDHLQMMQATNGTRPGRQGARGFLLLHEQIIETMSRPVPTTGPEEPEPGIPAPPEHPDVGR